MQATNQTLVHVQSSSFSLLHIGNFAKFPPLGSVDGLPVVSRGDVEGPYSEASRRREPRCRTSSSLVDRVLGSRVGTRSFWFGRAQDGAARQTPRCPRFLPRLCRLRLGRAWRRRQPPTPWSRWRRGGGTHPHWSWCRPAATSSMAGSSVADSPLIHGRSWSRAAEERNTV